MADMIPSRKFSLYHANLEVPDNRKITHYGATYLQKDTLKSIFFIVVVGWEKDASISLLLTYCTLG